MTRPTFIEKMETARRAEKQVMLWGRQASLGLGCILTDRDSDETGLLSQHRLAIGLAIQKREDEGRSYRDEKQQDNFRPAKLTVPNGGSLSNPDEAIGERAENDGTYQIYY